jgi:outer membrane protein assembly factor BamD
MQSPNPNLDQTPTRMAIDELQVFVNTYPNSPLVDSANTLVDRLALKLETKDFLNSKQYYTIKKYKAAVVALNNFMQRYPASKYKERSKLLILKSYYELAINSIEEKKEERFDKGIEAYYDFIDNFAGSNSINEAETIFAKLVKAREEFLLSKTDTNEL